MPWRSTSRLGLPIDGCGCPVVTLVSQRTRRNSIYLPGPPGGYESLGGLLKHCPRIAAQESLGVLGNGRRRWISDDLDRLGSSRDQHNPDLGCRSSFDRNKLSPHRDLDNSPQSA